MPLVTDTGIEGLGCASATRHMGAAFLQAFPNSPIPLYGTLLSTIIASAVR